MSRIYTKLAHQVRDSISRQTHLKMKVSCGVRFSPDTKNTLCTGASPISLSPVLANVKYNISLVRAFGSYPYHQIRAKGSHQQMADELGVRRELVARWKREYSQYKEGSFSGHGNANLTEGEKKY